MIYLKAIVGFALTFIIVDSIWIGNVVLKLYEQDVAPLMASSVNVVGAVLFYVAYIIGCVWFAVIRQLNSTSLSAMINGALLGALCYSTFTLTNYAVLAGWTATIVVSDILWGAFITGLSAFISHWFATR